MNTRRISFWGTSIIVILVLANGVSISIAQSHNKDKHSISFVQFGDDDHVIDIVSDLIDWSGRQLVIPNLHSYGESRYNGYRRLRSLPTYSQEVQETTNVLLNILGRLPVSTSIQFPKKLPKSSEGAVVSFLHILADMNYWHIIYRINNSSKREYYAGVHEPVLGSLSAYRESLPSEDPQLSVQRLRKLTKQYPNDRYIGGYARLLAAIWDMTFIFDRKIDVKVFLAEFDHIEQTYSAIPAIATMAVWWKGVCLEYHKQPGWEGVYRHLVDKYGKYNWWVIHIARQSLREKLQYKSNRHL
jgi:hypothetical protein